MNSDTVGYKRGFNMVGCMFFHFELIRFLNLRFFIIIIRFIAQKVHFEVAPSPFHICLVGNVIIFEGVGG